MSVLSSDIIALSPNLYWRMNDAQGSASVHNSGTVVGGNATTGGTPQLGVPPLVLGSTDTSAFLVGNSTDNFNAGNIAAMTINTTTSFWLFMVFAAFQAPVTPSGLILSQGASGQFGGFQIGVDKSGFFKWDMSSNSGVVIDFVTPPFVTDGRVHSAGFVRDGVAHTLTWYLDGSQVQQRADPTAGLLITHAASNIRIGNADSLQLEFAGQISDVVFSLGTQPASTFSVLHQDVYNGNAPPFGTGAQQVVTEQLAQLLALGNLIYAAVHKVF